MARVPLLERAYGQDRLARIHRFVGFTSFNLMLTHIVLITWGYAAGSLGPLPRRAVDPDLDLPRDAAGRRRHRVPGPGGRHQHPRRAPPDPLRVLAPAPSLRLLGRRPRAAAPALDRPRVPVLPRPHRVLVDGVGALGRHRRLLAGAAAGVAQRPPPAPGDLGGAGGSRGRVGLHGRTAPGPAAGRGGPVLPLAVPRPPGLDPGEPVLALGGARRPQPADQRPGRRRRQPRRPRADARHPGAPRGTLRPPRRARPNPPPARVHRRRRRHRAVARAGRGHAVRAR